MSIAPSTIATPVRIVLCSCKRMSRSSDTVQGRMWRVTGLSAACQTSSGGVCHRFLTRPGTAPHLSGELDDHAQLRPLLVLGQNVALLGRGEAALRAQGELVEVGVFRGLLDAALDVVLLLER